MTYNVNVIYEKDEHGYYVFCPQLEGCQSQGATLEEARGNIQEAIELYLETLSQEEITERLSHEVMAAEACSETASIRANPILHEKLMRRLENVKRGLVQEVNPANWFTS